MATLPKATDRGTDMLWRLRARLLYYFALHSGNPVVSLQQSTVSLLLEIPVDEVKEAIRNKLAPELAKGRILASIKRDGTVVLEIDKTIVRTDDINSIFEHWKRNAEKNKRTRLTPRRREKIRLRLQEFSAQDLKRAIDAMLADDFYNPKQPGKKAYNDIELVCRTTDHVERFLEMSDATNSKQKQSIRDRIRSHS